MRNMTIVQRFSCLCFLALLLFAVVFVRIVTNFLEQNMLARSKHMTASIVSEEVRNELQAADHFKPKTGSDYDTFAKIVSHLSFGPNVERIKIWNKDKTIVWADDKRLVGKVFPDNEELNEALEGEIASEISRLDKDEQNLERHHGRLLELYIPVRFEDSDDIEVVYEIYQNLDPLYADISHQKKIVWFSTIIGFSFLYLMLFGIVRNASRRIESQTKEIAHSEERYRSLVQSAQDGIISIDREGKIILSNRSTELIFGYSNEELIGQPITTLMSERYKTEYETYVNHFYKTGDIKITGKAFELTGLRKNGNSFPMELSLSVSGDSDDMIMTGFLRDISERKAIQAQLFEAERQNSVALVAGSIGHELKNTVTAIRGFAELLRLKPEDVRLAQQCGEVFDTQSERLKLHANNLLTLSEPKEPEMKVTSIESILEKVTGLLHDSGIIKNFKIVKNFANDLPPVLCDEMQLEQIIRNLEINAAHAMGNDGTLTLSTRLSDDHSYAEVSIADTGHGISDDKREQIFLPFHTTKEKGKGTGLGMYIVKQILDQHKGYIHLESELGVGTTVTTGLPVAT